MIRHILLFALKDGVPDDVRAAMFTELAGLPGAFEQIQEWELGANESERDGTFDYGMTMTFADRAKLNAYLSSERHEAFVRDRFKPIVSRRAIVTFDVH